MCTALLCSLNRIPMPPHLKYSLPGHTAAPKKCQQAAVCFFEGGPRVADHYLSPHRPQTWIFSQDAYQSWHKQELLFLQQFCSWQAGMKRAESRHHGLNYCSLEQLAWVWNAPNGGSVCGTRAGILSFK